MFTNKAQHGISLIELILFIVIVSIAVAALLSVLNVNTKGSVDPLLRKQALAIAESLLEEVELHDFSNTASGLTPRSNFINVKDYDGFTGRGDVVTGVPQLASYNVNIVVDTNFAWGTIPAGEVAQITVTVTGGGQTIDAVGYRVNY